MRDVLCVKIRSFRSSQRSCWAFLLVQTGWAVVYRTHGVLRITPRGVEYYANGGVENYAQGVEYYAQGR